MAAELRHGESSLWPAVNGPLAAQLSVGTSLPRDVLAVLVLGAGDGGLPTGRWSTLAPH